MVGLQYSPTRLSPSAVPVKFFKKSLLQTKFHHETCQQMAICITYCWNINFNFEQNHSVTETCDSIKHDSTHKATWDHPLSPYIAVYWFRCSIEWEQWFWYSGYTWWNLLLNLQNKHVQILSLILELFKSINNWAGKPFCWPPAVQNCHKSLLNYCQVSEERGPPDLLKYMYWSL